MHHLEHPLQHPFNSHPNYHLLLFHFLLHRLLWFRHPHFITLPPILIQRNSIFLFLFLHPLLFIHLFSIYFHKNLLMVRLGKKKIGRVEEEMKMLPSYKRKRLMISTLVWVLLLSSIVFFFISRYRNSIILLVSALFYSSHTHHPTQAFWIHLFPFPLLPSLLLFIPDPPVNHTIPKCYCCFLFSFSIRF